MIQLELKFEVVKNSTNILFQGLSFFRKLVVTKAQVYDTDKENLQIFTRQRKRKT